MYVGSCGLIAPCFNTQPKFSSAELGMEACSHTGQKVLHFHFLLILIHFLRDKYSGKPCYHGINPSPFLHCVVAACAHVGWFC